MANPLNIFGLAEFLLVCFIEFFDDRAPSLVGDGRGLM